MKYSRFFLLYVIPVFLYFVSYSQKPELKLPIGHTAAVQSVCFSPDGQYALSSSLDYTLKLWDIQSGKEIKSFQGPFGCVYSVCFSPDGRFALSGSNDKTLKLWDIQNGKEIKSFVGHTGPVLSVCFSPDGRYVLSGSMDKSLKLWDIQSGKEIKSFVGHTGYVFSVCFSPDGQYALSGSGDKSLKLWDLHIGKEIKSFKGHTGDVNEVCFSPDGLYALSGSDDKTLKLWDIQSGKEIKSFEGHKNIVNSVCFSPDGRYALSGSFDKTLKLWDIQSGKEIKSFEGHKNIVNSVCFSPDGQYALSGSDDNTLKLWDLQIGKEIKSFKGHSFLVTQVSFSPDGRYALSGSGVKSFKLWDLQSGKEIKSFEGHTDWVVSVCFSPDGQYALSGSFDKTLKLWDIQSGKEIKSLEGHTDTVQDVCFSPDGRYVLSGSSDKSLKLWDIQSGKEIKSFKDTSDVYSVCFSPDGRYALSGSADKSLKLWDIQRGKEIKSFKGHTSWVISVCFSPDGRYALSGSADSTIKLWDIQSGKEIKSFVGHNDIVTSACFSPDGRYVLSGSWDNTLKLWDIQSGKEIKSFEGHSLEVFSVCFSPDGRFALSSSKDNLIKLWDIQSGKEIATLISVDSTDWIITTPSGLFDASEGAMNLMYYVSGMKVIEFDRLKDQYWIPGLLPKLMSGSPLPQLNDINELKFEPEVELSEVKNDILNVKLIKSTGGYGKVSIKINGKEITGDARGPGFDTSQSSQTLQVNLKGNPFLLPGKENTITVSAFSADGYVTSRGVNVIYVPENKDTNAYHYHFYAVVCGINEYINSNINLRYSVSDAKAMASSIETAAGNLFGKDRTHVYLLTSPGNKLPTKDNIRQTFEEIASKSTANDILFIYLSGHGITWGETNPDFYYLTSDAYSTSPQSFNNINIRGNTTVSVSELIEMIRKISALKQVIIIDACGSGQAVDNLYAMRTMDEDSRKAFDRMKEKMGMYVLSGCAADAVSYEATTYGQGFLTYSLLEAMKGAALKDNRFVDVETMCEHACSRVPEMAKGIGGIQQPKLLSGKSGSFDIGLLNEKDRVKIPLSSVKPVFVESSFIDVDALEDILGLGKTLDERLYEISSRGTESQLVYFRVRDFENACKITGKYKQKNGKISLTGKIKCAGKESPLLVQAENVGGLVNKIIEKAVNVK